MNEKHTCKRCGGELKLILYYTGYGLLSFDERGIGDVRVVQPDTEHAGYGLLFCSECRRENEDTGWQWESNYPYVELIDETSVQPSD